MKFSPKSIYEDVGSLRYIIYRMDNSNMNLTSNEYSKLLSETSSKSGKLLRNAYCVEEDYPLTYQELKGLIN